MHFCPPHFMHKGELGELLNPVIKSKISLEHSWSCCLQAATVHYKHELILTILVAGTAQTCCRLSGAVEHKTSMYAAQLACCCVNCDKDRILAPAVSCRRSRFGQKQQLSFRHVSLSSRTQVSGI